MTKTNIIKAGYRLTVSSWENDADHARTLQKDGLNLDETKFIVDIISLYRSGNLGNMYQPQDKEYQKEITALRKVIAKHPNAHKFLSLEIEQLEDDENIRVCVHENILYDFMGSGDFYSRVYESHQVEYIPVEIQIEDVTSKLNSL